jgi:hypothetical protein
MHGTAAQGRRATHGRPRGHGGRRTLWDAGLWRALHRIPGTFFLRKFLARMFWGARLARDDMGHGERWTRFLIDFLRGKKQILSDL